MATPVPDIRIDWRNDGLNYIANDGFETNTTGWSAGAGINAAATSITRSTADFYAGAAMAIVVTTATSGSGVNYDFGTTTFSSGRTYRFRLYAKSVSGTTSAKLIMGSLGTAGDRATTTMTLTTSWALYSVSWTPSANRTDAEADFTNNAASIMTARIDHVEAFEAIDDVTADVDSLSYTRGANFDGSVESPGQATLHLNNITGKYSPDNTASPLSGLLVLGRPVWIRSTYAGVPYANFYGYIRRIIPNPGDRTAEIVCEDPLYRFGRQETSIVLSLSRSIRDFRVAILADIGEPVARQSLAYGVESDIVYTEADQVGALFVLSELNVATGTVHYIKPHVSSSTLYVYTTVDRASIQAQAVDETFNDDITDLTGYDFTDEALVNSQRVFPTARREDDVASVVWESPDVPLTIDAYTVFWAGGNKRAAGSAGSTSADVTFNDPVFEQALTVTGTGILSTVFTPFSRSAKIEVSTVSGAQINTMFITGRPAPRLGDSSVLVEDLTVVPDRYPGSDISSDFIGSLAMADGLARWWLYRYKGGAARPDLTVQNRHPSELQRDISDRLSLNFALLGISAKQFLVRSLTTTVEDAATVWRTTYALEAIPTAVTLFTLDGTAAQGLGGANILGT